MHGRRLSEAAMKDASRMASQNAIEHCPVLPPPRNNALLGSAPVLRVGIPHVGGTLAVEAARAGYPALISASACWDISRGRFKNDALTPLIDGDWALDSAGFTAMKRWSEKGPQLGMLGIYPWTLVQYMELAGCARPAWWAQPDFCVEVEIARDDAARALRIEATTAALEACYRLLASWWLQHGVNWLQPPVPVVQGFFADDYRRSLDAALECNARWNALFDAPALIGVGSICRRPVEGRESGVLAVVNAIAQNLPAGTRLHLFGVKSAAMARLAGHPAIASFDSMAWDVRARRAAFDAGISCSMAHRSRVMHAWMNRQQDALLPRQASLLL